MRYIENQKLINVLRANNYKPRHSEFISEDTLYDIFDWVIENTDVLPVIYSRSHESWEYRLTI